MLDLPLCKVIPTRTGWRITKQTGEHARGSVYFTNDPKDIFKGFLALSRAPIPITVLVAAWSGTSLFRAATTVRPTDYAVMISIVFLTVSMLFLGSDYRVHDHLRRETESDDAWLGYSCYMACNHGHYREKRPREWMPELAEAAAKAMPESDIRWRLRLYASYHFADGVDLTRAAALVEDAVTIFESLPPEEQSDDWGIYLEAAFYRAMTGDVPGAREAMAKLTDKGDSVMTMDLIAAAALAVAERSDSRVDAIALARRDINSDQNHAGMRLGYESLIQEVTALDARLGSESSNAA